MKKTILILFILCFSVPLLAQNINGRFSSSIYTLERYDSANTSDKYLRSFQSLRLNINEGNFSIKTRVGFETDIANPLDNDPRFRFYNLYFEARKLLDVATLRIGRQSFFNGLASGLYDGVNLKVKTEDFTVTGFYGGNVPAYQKLELTDDWANDYVLSGKISTTVVPNFRFSLSYIDKNFKPVEYTAIRLDEDYIPYNALIKRESQKYKYVSGEASYFMKDIFNVNLRYDYDLNFEQTSKIEVSGRYEQIENLGISLYYNFREPKIRYNSIFALFDYGNTQEIEAGVDYRIIGLFTLVGKYGRVTYEDDNSDRFTLGVNSQYGGVSYRMTNGYAGELDALSVYSSYPLFDGLFTPSIGVSITNYKISEDSEENDITAILAGFNVRPWRVLSFDVQGQYFNNELYENDYRLLFKINYWFNNNLNLL